MTNLRSIENLDVDDLLFDPKNPRFPSRVNGEDETAVLEWMLDDATIVELMMSIGEKDYFPGEPLLVVPTNPPSDKYIVIEGNRRLTAVKLLRDPEKAPIRKSSVKEASEQAIYHPTKLPVVEFPERKDIIYYLGYRHFTGIKTWGSLAKAKYLKQLRATIPGESSEQYRALAKAIGSRTDVVARTLAGLAVLEKIEDQNFFRIKNLTEDNISFSILTTALNYQNIHKFIGMDDAGDESLNSLKLDSLKELTSWLFEKNSEGVTRLGESRNLADLNRVLDSNYENALTAFRNGRSLSESVLFTNKPIEIFQNSISKAKFFLDAAWNSINTVDEFSSSDMEILSEIRKTAGSMVTLIRDKLSSSDEI